MRSCARSSIRYKYPVSEEKSRPQLPPILSIHGTYLPTIFKMVKIEPFAVEQWMDE